MHMGAMPLRIYTKKLARAAARILLDDLEYKLVHCQKLGGGDAPSRRKCMLENHLSLVFYNGGGVATLAAKDSGYSYY